MTSIQEFAGAICGVTSTHTIHWFVKEVTERK